MEHIKLTCFTKDEQTAEALIALLADEGFTGFEVAEEGLLAYLPGSDRDLSEIEALIRQFGIDYEVSTVPEQNWNAMWESNFEPVIIPGFCTVKAHFHSLDVTTPFLIDLTPKMSFGTGHHATTQLMMEAMRALDFEGKKVLDFGTGTGILAILAAMMGAREICAIDNDEWSITNALENCANNGHPEIQIANRSVTEFPTGNFDIVLANINRNVLLQHMFDIHSVLSTAGYVVMSGILTGDVDRLVSAAVANDMRLVSSNDRKGWMCLTFRKL
jgi:ribosomal protein L11 methyltransferase